MAITTEKSIVLESLKFIAKDLVGDILYFPVWWYTAGLKKMILGFWENWKGLASGMGLPILFRSIGKPMYGDYTKSGRVISFFMRIIHLGFLSIATLIYGLIIVVLAFIWVILPLFIIYNIIFQIFGPF